jgi:hypothetical protein
MSNGQTSATNNQEIIKIIFTNFLFPIVLGILAFIASNTVNTWRSRRRQSLLGSVILQSFIEEVENGVGIMESVQAMLNNQPPKTIGALPRASWSGIQSVSDELLERIICTTKEKTFSGFPPKEIRIHLKNYFEHMCKNFDSVTNAIALGTNWQDEARSYIDERGNYIDAAKGVLQMLKDAQQLLENNSKTLWPK